MQREISETFSDTRNDNVISSSILTYNITLFIISNFYVSRTADKTTSIGGEPVTVDVPI